MSNKLEYLQELLRQTEHRHDLLDLDVNRGELDDNELTRAVLFLLQDRIDRLNEYINVLNDQKGAT